MPNYLTNIPVNAQAPSLFPAQCRDNWLRLKQVIESEHNFVTTGSLSDGYHKVITFVRQTGDPAMVSRGQLYTKEYTPTESSTSPSARDALFYEDTLGNVLQITPFGASFGIRLAGKLSALGAGATSPDITIGTFNYTALVFAYWLDVSIRDSFYMVTRQSTVQEINNPIIGGGTTPSVVAGSSANTIAIKNNDSAQRDIYYSILYIQSAA